MSPVTLTDLAANRCLNLTEDQKDWILSGSIKSFQMLMDDCDKHNLNKRDRLLFMYNTKGMPYLLYKALPSISDQATLQACLEKAKTWRCQTLEGIYQNLIEISPSLKSFPYERDFRNALDVYKPLNLRYFTKKEIISYIMSKYGR